MKFSIVCPAVILTNTLLLVARALYRSLSAKSGWGGLNHTRLGTIRIFRVHSTQKPSGIAQGLAKSCGRESGETS